MAQFSTSTLGRFLLFVAFLAIGIFVIYDIYTNGGGAIKEILDYVIEKITCLFNPNCYSADDTTAIDSAKALACAIDATAYWSEGSDGRKEDLEKCLVDITSTSTTKDVCKNLFQDEKGKWFMDSCKTGITNVTPTGGAILRSSGSIISKLIEWSGGGNKITGNAISRQDIGNSITGYATATTCTPPACTKRAEEKMYYCTSTNVEKNCGTDVVHADYTGLDACTPTLTGGCNDVKCSDCKKGGFFDECPEDECKLISKNWDSRGIGTCTWAWGFTENSCTGVQSAAQSKSKGETDADKILAQNPGKSIKFGKATIVCNAGGSGVECNVNAFELPQDVDTDIGKYEILGFNVAEFVADWFALNGEPRYLVYPETFPEGIEGIWTYDGMDAIVAAAAVGGALNVGLGPLKVTGSAAKGALVSVVKNKAIKGAIAEGKGAAYESFIKSYGTSNVLEKYILSRSVLAMVGKEGSEGIFMATYRGAMKRNLDIVDGSGNPIYPQLKNLLGGGASGETQLALLDDYGNVIRSTIDDSKIDDDFVKKIAGERLGQLPSVDYALLAQELKAMRAASKAGTLLTSGEKDTITAAIKKEVQANGAFDKLIAKNLKAAVGTEGKIEKIRRYFKLGGRTAKLQEKLEKEKTTEISEEGYKDLMQFVSGLDGSITDSTSGKAAVIEMYERNWNQLYASGGSKEVMNELAERAGNSIKGMTGLPADEGLLTLSTRKKVMGSMLAVSYLSMVEDFSTEKYGTCGTAALCLHWPKWFSFIFDDPKGNNVDFKFGKEVKSNFSDLVMLEVKKITSGVLGTSVMRLNLISPCKADLTVKAYNATSEKCKCKNYYGSDTIWFKLQKNFCKVDTSGTWVVYTLPDGTCPASVKGKKLAADAEQDFEVNATNEDLNSQAIFPCPITNKNNLYEDLDFCGRNKMYDKNCLISKGNINAGISDEDYRKWLLSASRKDLNECVYDPLRECSCTTAAACPHIITDRSIRYDGLRIGYLNMIPAPPALGGGKACDGNKPSLAEVYKSVLIYNQTKYSGSSEAYKNLDTVAQPLNLKPNVLDNDKLTPVAVCVESWTGIGMEKYPCLTVSVDSTSMESYSKNGFGRNFCAEKKDSAEDWIESGCEWGTIPVSIAIVGLSGGLATPVALYVVGMGGTLCSKIASDAGKWPNNQY